MPAKATYLTWPCHQAALAPRIEVNYENSVACGIDRVGMPIVVVDLVIPQEEKGTVIQYKGISGKEIQDRGIDIQVNVGGIPMRYSDFEALFI